ncbi:MAG TPA: VCBS repeat-containing protein, partial [Chloroflexaceae bacterium]|nr:VCBS repeat-containing protein [Chloroflexaceae bacterium]
MVARQRGARPCTTVARLALVTLVALAACPLAPRPPAARAEAPGFDARRFFGHEGIVSLAVGDLDGDGDLDAVGGGSATFAFGLVYLNDGAGVLTAGPSRELLPPPGTIGSGEASHVALGDMDGDGDLDIVTAGTGAFSPTVAERNLIYFNGGVGQFPPEDARGFSQDAAEVSALALGDLDGDGDLDIVEARLGGQNRVYLNDGAGGFDTSLLLGGPDTPTADVEVGDLDGDGALDILEVNRFGQSRVYLGDGAGGFDEAGALPVGAPAGGLARAALGDVDGDGDLDIVADLQPGADAARPTGAIFLNDGAGGFPEDPSLPFGGPRRDAAALALGDLDGDGLLDIVAGNFANPGAVYLGQRSGGALGYSEQPLRTTSTFAVALGELNGDGALDIVVGDYFQSAVHLSSGFGRLRPEPVLDTPLGFFAFGRVRAGDLDGDGALDFVVSELAVAPPDPQPGPRLLVYRGDGAGGFPPDRRAELSTGGAGVGDFALGDVDGDGDLDLVAATRGAGLLVLRNDGAGGFPGPPQRFGPEALDARRLALGDLNNDGALDAVVAYLPLAGDSTDPRETGFDRIFFGDGRGGFDGGRPLDEDGRDTSSLALGDLDGDGDSDLVVQDAREATVYLNDGAGGMAAAGAIGPLGAQGPELALGDLDGDGDLDVVSADFNQSWIARNDGAGGFGPPAIFTKGSYARPLLGDLDGDGDLDIVADAVYRNGGAGEVAARLSLEPADPADLGGQPLGGLDAVALGDFDGDGAPDVLAASFNDPVQIFLYRNRLARPAGLPNNPPAVRIAQPAPPPATLGEASQVVSLTYTLADPEGDPVREVRAFFSLDGGGSWRPAAAAPGAATTGLAAAPGGSEHVFPWDLFASGVFGQADRVAFRIEAYQAGGGFDAAAPSWQRPYSATQTAPFRVRGTQVRVLGEDGAPRQGAVVYRLPAGAGTGALPLGPAGGAAFSSDGEGFLQGRGALAPGDRLVALAPVAAADSYGLYLTSAAPTAEGLAATEVLTPGVQTLRLAAAHPLVLFTLEVSLEWDARGDAQQLARLEADLRRASAALYDWTDGQAALGEVVVYHDRERWNEAHIRVYGTNRLRPNANQGGIVGAPISETLVLDGAERTITYEPGQVRMGAVWNRYGEPGAIGDDWPRTLAHELGHFALFLDDNYLGLDAAGRLVQVSTCAGAMADPYVDDVSELRPRAGWLPGCALTLSNRLTGRADWETFAAFYERPALGFALRPPGAFNANPGPAALPLAVTQLRFVEPAAPPPDLGAATVYLVDEGGGALQPDAGALALLFQAGRGRLLDLGGVVLDRAEVRGARQGDRLCVFEAARGRLGCERLRAGDQQL